MKGQIQIVQVQENVFGDFSNGMLRHFGKNGIPQFIKTESASSSNTIWKMFGSFQKIAILHHLQPSSMLVATVATVSGAESIVNMEPDCTFK